MQMWADMAVDSAENYRTAEAGTKNATGSVKMQARNGEASRPYSYDALVSKKAPSLPADQSKRERASTPPTRKGKIIISCLSSKINPQGGYYGKYTETRG